MSLIIGLAITGGMLALVVAPLLSAEASGSGGVPVDVTPLADLKRRRLVVYENLQDLEFEYQARKMAREDYQRLRADYLGEAAALMVASQDAEQAQESEAWIEREVAARRARPKPALAGRPEEYVCRKCGFQNPVPVRFCGECGARIARSSPKS